MPLELVCALVLERASGNSTEATVLFETRAYERADGRPIEAIYNLTDAVIFHIRHPLPYRNDYDGDLVAFSQTCALDCVC